MNVDQIPEYIEDEEGWHHVQDIVRFEKEHSQRIICTARIEKEFDQELYEMNARCNWIWKNEDTECEYCKEREKEMQSS
jgi:hypothetical protein